MDFEPTAEQQAFRDRARDLVARLVAPAAAELSRTEGFPVATFREMGRAGLLGMNVPVADGGTGAGTIALALALHEVAYACASTAVGMSVTNMVGESIARFGSDALRRRYLPQLISGEAVCGAFCLSEPGSGSDAASLEATARRDGDAWVLDGTKAWITSGDHAAVMIVMARTGGSAAGHRGISAFIVEPGFDGVSIGKPEDKCGLRGSRTVPVVLDACRVPLGNLLGDEGVGFRIAMTALDGGRITIGAMANGIARAALDQAAGVIARRPGGGGQAAQSLLADMATGLAASEHLVMRAAWLKERAGRGSGRARFTREAAMAKLYATENVKRVTGMALEAIGPEATTAALPVERFMRDARVTTIFEGTTEIQKLVVAREVIARLTAA